MFRRIFLAGAAWCVCAFGADVTGIWTGTLTDRNGDPQDFSFRFVQKGDTLSGKMYGDNESTPIAAARVDGDKISFTVTTELNGQITTSLYVATVSGNQMEVNRSRVDAKAKPSDGQAFKLKRLT